MGSQPRVILRIGHSKDIITDENTRKPTHSKRLGFSGNLERWDYQKELKASNVSVRHPPGSTGLPMISTVTFEHNSTMESIAWPSRGDQSKRSLKSESSLESPGSERQNGSAMDCPGEDHSSLDLIWSRTLDIFGCLGSCLDSFEDSPTLCSPRMGIREGYTIMCNPQENRTQYC